MSVWRPCLRLHRPAHLFCHSDVAEFDAVGSKFEGGGQGEDGGGSAGCFGLVGQESVGWGAEVSVDRVMNGAGASVRNQLKCAKVVSHVPKGEC